MIIFLAAMLFALGSWLHLSMELDIKKKALEELSLKEQQRQAVIDGGVDVKGSKKMNDDPVDGLSKVLEKKLEIKRVVIGAPAGQPGEGGSEMRRDLYEKEFNNVSAKWPESAEHRKQLYDAWKNQSAQVQATVGRLFQAMADSDKNIAEAKSKLEAAVEAEKTALRESVLSKKKMSDELSGIRFEQEEVLDKRAKITRDIQAQHDVIPQGKVVHADEAVKIAVIDIGSLQGVRRGMIFDVYSGAHVGKVLKGHLEVTEVSPRSSTCNIIGPKVVKKFDPNTFWEATDSRMKYSVYSAGGNNEDTAQELEVPKTKADRLEAIKLEELKKQKGLEGVEEYLASKDAPTAPVVDLGKGFVPIVAGDWINNTDFIPLVTDSQWAKKTTAELLAMPNVNIGPLTFYFTEAVPPYRKEFLKRMCEKNLCRTVEAVNADVNIVVTSAGKGTSIELLSQKQRDSHNKDGAEFKKDQAILDAMIEGKKYGAEIIPEDELEAFFTRRNRKLELLRGKTNQPGQATFYIAGETRDRSVPHLQQWIRDHGGIVATDLNGNVDYVVTGAGLKEDFYKLIKEKGLKIIREDELPKYFGQ
jgi:hypothetical protein